MIKTLTKKLCLKIINNVKYSTGLYGASSLNVSTGYNKAWLRDNFYVALGVEAADDIESVKKTYYALFDLLKKHESKIDKAIAAKPTERNDYIHARFHPLTYDEFNENWGNKQNDAVGAFLFKVGDLYKKGTMILRDSKDYEMLQKLVYYLESIEYWHDCDNGVWEENEEVHTSSVGACVAGLKAVKNIVDVPEWLIAKGADKLNELLPRESVTKDVDLAQLSLIYPYNIVTNEQKYMILENVEKHLVRKRGVIRYHNDYYYNHFGKEAEWTFGFPWLAVIYKQLGDKKKYRYYMNKTYSVMNWKGELPELYLGDTKNYNENTPLAWSQAMMLCALK